MTTYPPGPISRYGRQLLDELVDPQITIVSPDEDHIFYLSGPLAPLPGCQNGVVLSKGIRGLHPMFNHLDYKGARQPGVTWADTVYDPAEIDLDIEFSGTTTSGLRQVVRDWMASWDPKRQCTMSWFTPEAGEWWCHPRLFKAPPDVITQSPGRHRRLPMTWTIRNDDAFWRSVDSVGSFKFGFEDVGDEFTRADNSASNGLGSNWTQTYTYPTSNGSLGIASNAAGWYEQGVTANYCKAKHVSTSDTDFQVITIKLAGFYEFPFPSTGYIDILGRMSADGNSYIRFRLSPITLSVSVYKDGSEVWTYGRPLLISPLWTETFTMIVGTSASTPSQIRILRDGFDIFTVTEPGYAYRGASYRGWGFAVGVGGGVISQLRPASVDWWHAGDNATVTQSGFIPFTNRGTEDVDPIYLCYGPGTFYIGNGSGSTGAANMISFGPLNAGQIAMVDTNPRRKGVIDISPGQAAASTSLQQQFIDALVSLAFNQNFTPLLNLYKSALGVLPAQGPLYSKLNGRFTRPISGHVDGTALVTEQVAVRVVGGNADTKIVGAITPLRRWPE